jgi:O-antigen/teichoic acid export membrane protein
MLARRLGSAGFGAYALMAATIVVGNMLTTFGTDMVLMREIAAHDDLSGLPAALMIQLVLSALCVALIAPAASLLPNLGPSTLSAVRIYSLALFPLAFYTVFSTALRGKERMDAYALLGFMSVLMQVAVIGFLPVDDLQSLAVALVLIQIVVALLAGVLCTIQIQKFWSAWHFTTASSVELLRNCVPIAALAVLGAVYQKLSIGMLSGLSAVAMTGWFAAAQRAVEASKTVHVAVFTAIYPVMARTENGLDGVQKDPAGLRFSWYLLLGAAAMAALCLCLFAGPLVRVLFGADFAPAIPALRILAWILIPYTVNTFLSLFFLAAKQARKVALALSVSLCALIVLNFFLIPLLGLAGAALAALAAESVQALLFLFQRGAMTSSLFRLGLSKEGTAYELSKLS